MRDLAIRLETVLAPVRTDDLMCRQGDNKVDIKPEAVWKPEASETRAMLPRHLLALASVMRPRPVAKAEPSASAAGSAPTQTVGQPATAPAH